MTSYSLLSEPLSSYTFHLFILFRFVFLVNSENEQIQYTLGFDAIELFIPCYTIRFPMNLIRFSPISIYLFSDSVAFFMSSSESARAPFVQDPRTVRCRYVVEVAGERAHCEIAGEKQCQ